MNRKTIAWILKAPMILVILGAFGGGIYAAAKNIQGITFGTPVVMAILLALYIWGEYMANK